MAKVILYLLLSGIIYSQQPTLEWIARYPGPTNDLRGPYFKVDKLGNSYLAGTHEINDSINILVVKYNTLGIQQWEKLYKYPGEGYFAPMGLALDTFGNVYVTSIYGQDVFSNLNILTVKFDLNNGNVIWAKKYVPPNGNSTPEDIVIDKLNNIYVVGATDSALLSIKYNLNGDSIWINRYQALGKSYGNSCTLDDSLNIIITGKKTHCVSPGNCLDTVLTVKYNPLGFFRWAKTYFYPINPSITTGLKITNDTNGNVFIAGKTRNSMGRNIYLTLKYDRNGTLIWTSIYDGPGSGDDNIKAINIDKTNSFVFVTGTISGVSNFGECATIKYNLLTGDSIWVRRNLGIYSIAGANDVQTDTIGNAYITGGTGNLNGANAILIIKYSSEGNLVWLTTYNGTGNGRLLALDRLNNVYVCGPIDSSYFIIKYSQTIGIHNYSNEIPFNYNLYQNYPNPFNPVTQIKFDLPEKSNVNLKVYDLPGRVVAELVSEELNAGSYKVDFDGSDLASGLYFYTLTTQNFTATKKMVLIK